MKMAVFRSYPRLIFPFSNTSVDTVTRAILQGQLPCLEVDGKLMPQSAAIARYLAREFDLMGRSSWEQAEIDVVIETMKDMMQPIVQMFYETDEERKGKQMARFKEEVFPKISADLEKILQSNRNGYFVGEGLTLADLVLFDGMYFPVEGYSIPLDAYPRLLAHRKMMAEHPKIAEWIAKRPVTHN